MKITQRKQSEKNSENQIQLYDSNHHCRYTYGKNVKGRAKMEIRLGYLWGGVIVSYTDPFSGQNNRCDQERCNYDWLQPTCVPTLPCPITTLDVEVSHYNVALVTTTPSTCISNTDEYYKHDDIDRCSLTLRLVGFDMIS